jgi:LysM repeat protein
MKLPSFLQRLPKFRRRRPAPPRPRSVKMSASARRASPAPAYDSYDDDEVPTTRLSSAFFVVVVLHLVALGGIFAFHGIKAQRKREEVMNGPSLTAPAAVSPSADDQTYAMMATPAPALHPAWNPTAPVSKIRVHHVRAGETLAKLASAFDVTVADLASANSLKENAVLHTGETLNIPAPRSTAAAGAHATPATNDPQRAAFLATRTGDPTPASPKTYTVVKGDNPAAISRKLGVAQEELIKLNKIEDPTKLRIGQTLKVPAKSPKTAAN